MNAVLERYFMEVHEEAKGRVEQFHVAQELSFVDRKDGFHGFDFHDQALIDVTSSQSGSSKVKPLYSMGTTNWLTPGTWGKNSSRTRHFS